MEEEIVRVIKKGADEASNSSNKKNDKVSYLAIRSHGMKTRSSKYYLTWILEEQIIKVTDMGTSLGFDYYDSEVKMVDIIAKAISRVNGARLKMAKEN